MFEEYFKFCLLDWKTTTQGCKNVFFLPPQQRNGLYFDCHPLPLLGLDKILRAEQSLRSGECGDKMGC